MSCLHGVSFTKYCHSCAVSGKYSIDLKSGVRLVKEGDIWLVCHRNLGYLMEDGGMSREISADFSLYKRFSSSEEADNYLSTVGLPASILN